MSYEASTMSNNMQLAYNTDGSAMYTSMNRPAASPSPYHNPNGAGAGENDSMAVVTASIDGSGGVAVKRKRGRPRKYSADGSDSPAAVDGGGFLSPAVKRPRGRPPGSLNKQQPAASGSPGVGFMPHILDVKAGEDMLAKLMWFSQNSTRALCVMSANGAVSNVTLRQSPTSGGTVTYEGRFEILSLSGSFMVAEVDGQRSRTGGLSVALSGPDGRVLGGNVAGLLTAASPVQVIVGSFVPASQKQSKPVETSNNEAEVVNAPQSETSGGGLGYSLDQTTTTTAAANNHHSGNPQGMSNMPWR
ncbi:putative AT-hook motif nuclear-localized protein [Helianthus annuus]|uniref:AT-hook motif nuclear-localized protein n=1 Tax=Helianthus annuus TaxID=4232 RepID=A0A251S4B1_HELAN|nr:AT-hook motif nuclear-localized protein 10 [Helianthus annuus]KAF5762522.1 putative AT-hook motif nuclear-localized protein [Helianthus annuus]KAJ0440235.1 putative AT-hook motif nuclear-localized protein [Helianthus annuus]KAJ0445575.1 putative AT-hook motif nuclear-localized protein [Helianthus annuus]KAJ0462616.1 putative AT-hook motif nuclear-localized protein [Helianthus annuus]KAJ0643012.1 putative AT-hook motif nuclear-localized protein [Helianthus annuus]